MDYLNFCRQRSGGLPRNVAKVCLIVAACFGFASCGSESADVKVEGPVEEAPVTEVGAGDFSLDREWVRATLEGNREKLSNIRESLTVVRREVVSAKEMGNEVSLDGMRDEILLLIDSHAADLEEIQASVAQMRTVLANDGEGR
ncbi:hypothetical protein [Sulfuriroseicoccus oceanibius]|uniref:Uncharacterized protein n=1 Tax=Sulfuriroseicoccus oceanibius TaxID=2707525 RepID=A0A6B3L7G6_9BACT|nr:hypothetical protein [Sulfuriroseicoccus oceanibius]QQL44474.1 hypothetical protein G3M56_011370 [Sulfuriroseicoccus oceanibius]